MSELKEDTFVLDGTTFQRTRVVARLNRSSEEECPTKVLPSAHASKDTSQWYWQDRDNPDLVWCKFILDSEGVNKNWDYMPRSQLLASYATAKFKPMDMDHVVIEDSSLLWMNKKNPPVKNTIFGVMSDAAIADASGTILTPKQIKALAKEDDPDVLPSKAVTCVAWAALYYFLFPQTVGSLVNYIGNGQMKVSMERWIRQYDFLIKDGEDYQAVTRAQAEKIGLSRKWETRQQVNGAPVLRRTLSYAYGGVASTTNPANALSRFIQESKTTEKAKASCDDATMKILVAQHDEVVNAYAVSSSEAEKLALLAEHERIHKVCAAYLGS